MTAHHPVAKRSGRPTSFLRVEVDHRKKATGRFTLFSDGQILTGTLDGNPEILLRFERGRGANNRIPLAAIHSRYGACDH